MNIIAKWKCWHIQRIWHFSMYHVIQKTCSINHWKMNGCYGCKHQITENKITRLMIQISSIFLPNTWHLLSYDISDFHSHNIQCNAIHIVPDIRLMGQSLDSHLIKFNHSVWPFYIDIISILAGTTATSCITHAH